MTVSRVCFIGDGTLLGCGDEELLGWPGRLCRAARHLRRDLVCYNLGIRLDTSADVRIRWRSESSRRLAAPADSGLVFCFGVNDMSPPRHGGGVRVPMDESLANAEAIISEAIAWRRTLWIGPLPVRAESHAPGIDADGESLLGRNDRIVALNAAYRGLAEALGVPYLDAFNQLVGDPVWLQSLAHGDGTHPDMGGYAYLAGMVEQWEAWAEWQQPATHAAAAAARPVLPGRGLSRFAESLVPRGGSRGLL